jgi:Kef-type K+ transport system membrane component KefB
VPKRRASLVCAVRCRWPWPIGLVVLAGGAAFAQDGATGASIIVFLAELVALMATGRLLGESMQRVGQSPVMGQLLTGILLGPSALGAIWPAAEHWLFPPLEAQRAMADAVSQFGILLLLFLTGMEVDLKLVRRFGRAAISVSLCGVALPFAGGVALGALLPQMLLPGADERVLTTLFLGTVLAISSVKMSRRWSAR